MKKTLFLLALSAITLGSCQTMSFEDPETNTSSKGSKTMYFKCTGFSMTNMDTDISGDAESTRATSNSLQNATDNLLLGVYTMDGKLLDTLTYQTKNDPDIPYGTFSRTLEYGKYTILALGWNGSQQCSVHSLDSITFSEGWVPNTFLCRQNIVVNEAYSNSRTLTLKRCIARFIINFKDTNIPQELSEFIINISGAGNTLNSETRHCTQTEDFSRSIPVDIDPTNVKKLTTYCFLPADSTSVSVNIAAMGTQGETLAERTFTEVPMKINYSTSYTGNFFPISEFSGSVTFEIDFDGEYNYNF